MSVILMLSFLVLPSNSERVISCREDRLAAESAERITELPLEIQQDLSRVTVGQIGERNRPLRQSHVLISEERDHLRVRFYRALRFRGVWYVQYEETLRSGVQTLGYTRHPDGRFLRSPILRFGGPPCETIRAALSGVNTPLETLIIDRANQNRP